MATIMENDMNDPTPLSRESFNELLDLSDYAFNRGDAERWAYKGIKFLVFDNTDSETECDSDDPDGVLELGMESSLQKHDDPDGMLELATSMSSQEQDDPNGMLTLTKNLSLQEHDDRDGVLELAEELSLQQQNDPDAILELAKKRFFQDQSDGQGTVSKGDAISEKDSCDAASTDDTRNQPCSICSHIPGFPSLQKTRKFRLFRPQDLPISSDDTFSACNHYAAISYCWPLPEKDGAGNIVEPPRTYQVRDVDGTVRTNRALDDILDRAVGLALSTGVRTIWIDQECLPQPKDGSSVEDWKEQGLGLQAMDVVYARAAVTGGLLDAEFTRQAQINALIELMSCQITGEPGSKRPKGVFREHGHSLVDDITIKEAISFFRMICEDLYYTRAWVVQEGISAGSKLALVFRKAAEVSHMYNMGVWVKSNNPEGTYAYADYVRAEQQEKSGVICIPIQHFQRAINVADYLVERLSLRMRVNGMDTVFSELSTARDILQRAAALHSDVPKTPLWKLHYYADKGVMQTGGLSAVDAAGAWTLLQSRSCRDPQDFLAIMANMCGFDRRLDVTAVARRCKSLRAALIALALHNGDYSVLVPEGFARDIQGESQPTSSPYWLFPLCNSSRRMEYLEMRPGSFGSGDIQGQRRISENGLSLQAYSWTVDSVYTFEAVQTEYAQTWDDLKYLGRSFARLDGETEQAYNARQNSSIEGVVNRKALDTLARNNPDVRIILRNGDILTNPGGKPDPVSWASKMDDPKQARDMFQMTIDCYAKDLSSSKEFREGSYRVKLGITRYRVEHLPEMRKIIAEIIVATLRYLYKEDNVWATGLGNSIWHSIRRGAVHGSDEGLDLPDSIGSWLYDHPLIVEDPWSLFKLDDYPGESDEYSQLWFVERIMRDGRLWVGRYDLMPGSYTRHEANITGIPMLFPTQPEVFQEYSEQRMNPMMSSKGVSPQQYEAHRRFMTGCWDDPDADPGSDLEQQLEWEMRKDILDEFMETMIEDEPFSMWRVVRDGPDSIERELALCLFQFLSEKNAHEFLETMARFLAGNAFVNMVNIEHRKLWTRAADYHRHNSLVSAFDVDGPCKVVIPYDGNLERRTHAKRRSMSVCWVVEEGKGLEDEKDQNIENAGGLRRGKHTQLNQDTHKTYRVLSKVRGLWQLMDYPRQHYTFSWD